MSDAKKLCLGAAQTVITPPVGGRLYGYDPTTVSESVHDDLTASVFLFRTEDTDAMLISLTLCEADTKVCDELRGLASRISGVAVTRIMICCTHTHSGPNVAGNAGWGDIDRAYIDSVLLPRLSEAVEKAAGNVRPVTVGIGRGESFVGVNRREVYPDGSVRFGQNPWGCFDPTMTVLSFRYEDGSPAAHIIHYACHGTCAGHNHEITRDFSGIMCDRVSALFGGVTAFINGAEGDVGPRLSNGKTVGFGDIRYAEEHGGLAAADAVRIRRSIRHYSDAVLAADTYPVELPVKMRITLDEAKALREKYRGKAVNVDGQYAQYVEDVIASYQTDYTERNTKTVEQTLIRIGDVVLAGFPFEMFSEVARRVSAYAKVPQVLCVSLCNGMESYFVTEDQLCRGGYEVAMFRTASVQPYADNADTAYVNETVKNAEKIYQ